MHAPRRPWLGEAVGWHRRPQLQGAQQARPGRCEPAAAEAPHARRSARRRRRACPRPRRVEARAASKASRPRTGMAGRSARAAQARRPPATVSRSRRNTLRPPCNLLYASVVRFGRTRGPSGRSSTRGSVIRFWSSARRTVTRRRSPRSSSAMLRGSRSSRRTCSPIRRMPVMQPRRRWPRSACGCASSGATRSSRRGSTGWSSTRASTSPTPAARPPLRAAARGRARGRRRRPDTRDGALGAPPRARGRAGRALRRAGERGRAEGRARLSRSPRLSERSGMPVGTAKCYAHRARAGLRARLDRRARGVRRRLRRRPQDALGFAHAAVCNDRSTRQVQEAAAAQSTSTASRSRRSPSPGAVPPDRRGARARARRARGRAQDRARRRVVPRRPLPRPA